MTYVDVIILGAGASGLMCGAQAGLKGRSVLILEGSNKVGKKILMSGGGRCNFTNLDVTPQHYLSNNPSFCISALKRYTQWDFIALVDKYKIPYEQRKHGQLFCLNSAKDILAMLLSESQSASVAIKTHCEIKQVQPLLKPVDGASGARFRVNTNLGDFTCASVVVATGALSIPSMGASGFGYDLAKSFGHHVVATRAGLVPFTFSDGFKSISERLSGLAIDCDLSCEAAQFKEAVLFTHRGLSGPATLQLSNYWQLGQEIKIDLFPEMSLEMAQQWVRQLKSTHSKNVLRTVLNEYLAKHLVLELQAELWPDFAETPLAHVPDAVLLGIVNHLKAWAQKPSGTEGYRTAEVTLGGVDTAELSSKTMESKLQAGLYFIGEVVDVTGHLGGYNFQWAWSSGVAAGRAV